MAGARRQSNGIGDVVQRNLVNATLVGVGAYLVGYVLTFVLTVIDGVDTGDTVSAWKAVGWVFYSAHNVAIEQRASSGGSSVSRTIDLFAQDGTNLGSTVPQPVYLLVPVIVLFGAGYVAYQRAGSGLETPQAAAVGATVVVGYLVLTILGTFLFEASANVFGVQASIGPALVPAVVVAGIVYPIVFGAIGAVGATTQEGGGRYDRLR